MCDSFLLHEEDMRKDTHSPVICYFGAISDKSWFLHVLHYLSDGIGYGADDAVCLFPDSVTVDSEKFGEGVEFALHNGEAVVLSYEEFYYYLKKACENYLKKYGTGAEEIQAGLAKVRKRYNISE